VVARGALPSFFARISRLPGSSLAYDPSTNVKLSMPGAHAADPRPYQRAPSPLLPRETPPLRTGSYGLGEEEATSVVQDDRLMVSDLREGLLRAS